MDLNISEIDKLKQELKDMRIAYKVYIQHRGIDNDILAPYIDTLKKEIRNKKIEILLYEKGN